MASETPGQPRWTTVAGTAARFGILQARLQDEARQEFAGGLPAREAALAAAVLLGGGADPGLREPFVRLGLAHLFALSGLHVGIVGGLLLLGLRCFVRGPGGQLALMTAALTFYALLVDAPDSVVRAVGLVLASLGLKAAGRALDGLRILGLLFWLNVLWRPESLFDVGFKLSYLAAGGIIGGQRLLASDLAAWPRGWRWPARGILVSLAAQTTTLPVLAASFGMLPVAAPLLNLLAVPAFSLAAACLGAGLLTSLASDWVGHGLLACGWLLVRPLQAGATATGSYLQWLEVGLPVWGPWRLVCYVAWLCLVVAWLRRARGRRRMFALPLHVALLPLAAWTPPATLRDGSPQVWQYAVAQGDCALIRFPDGWTCLVDAGAARRGSGPFARDVWPHLRRQRLRRLDAVVLTHGHDDHTGGAAAAARRLEVGRWYAGGGATSPDGVPAGARLAAGDTLHAAGDWVLVCVHPPSADWQASNENDHSISLALCRRDSLYALWTGDLETSGERVMLAQLPPVKRGGLDVWKAGHHGSRTSGSEAFLAQTRPGLVVVSCGVANRHGHPSHGPYGAAAILRTDLHATVHLSWDGRGRLRWRTLYPLPDALAPPP